MQVKNKIGGANTKIAIKTGIRILNYEQELRRELSYAPVVFLTVTSALFSVFLSDCLAFFSLRTGFPGRWDLVVFTVLSVNDVVRCMSAKRVGTWVSLHLLAKSESILLRQASCHITVTLDTLSRLIISPSCLLPSTLNFSSEKVFLFGNSIHRLMPTWGLFRFL